MKAHYNLTGKLLKSLIIFAAITIFTINNSYATGFNFSPCISFSLSDLVAILAPSTPKEADFDEPFTDRVENFITSMLKPATPAEAEFDDAEASTTSLANVTPAEADFSDAEVADTDITKFSPSIPTEADFND
ncbi:MAG: hypothetical protein WCI48_07505 [Bacteroidota bacterium]|jgi:hypothetical protein